MLKQKVEGISLIVSLGASLLVLAMGIGIITSVEKSHQRSVDIENSIQFFYGSESSIEAALFHKKARGKGAHFPDVADTADAQKLDFYNGSLFTRWKLFGRAGIGTDPIIGMLREGEAVELPLFWDRAATPELPEDIEAFGAGDDFTLTFYRSSQHMLGDINTPGTTEYKFVEEFGEIDDSFRFPTSDPIGDGILIDWDMSRIETNVASQTFAVSENSERKYCTGGIATNPDPHASPAEKTHNFCKSHFNSNTSISLDADNAATPGKVNHRFRPDPPGDAPYTLGDAGGFEGFNAFDDPAFENFQLSFNSGFVQYANGTDKLRGIPYTIETNNKDVPTPYYQIVAEVDKVDKFNQRLEIQLKEEVANKNFRYVIFD